MASSILSFLVFAPVLGILALLFVPKNNEKVIKIIGILSTIPTLISVISIYISHMGGTSFEAYSQTMNWFGFSNNEVGPVGKLFSVKYQMSIDGFSLIMLLLTAVLCTLAAFASVKITKEWKGYFSLFLILQIGMLGVFTAGNMILFFLFFELTLISAFFLVGKWGYEQKEKAAYRFLVYNGLGSALLLFVIMTLQARVGTTDIHYLITHLSDNGLDTVAPISNTLRNVLFGALILAFGIKLPTFPFHSWMLKMHTQAPTSVVMLHAGVLLKIGAFGLIRFAFGMFPEQFHAFAPFLIILGVFNLLYGAFLAFIQTDFKLVLAYSSISHMGIVLMGLGALNEIGIQGAIFQLVSHGLIAALMFLLVGVIYDRTKTTDLEQLGGMAKTFPKLSGILLFATMASLGLPGLSGFISEFMAFVGLFEANKIIASIGTLGLILTAAYALRATLKLTFGDFKLPEVTKNVKDLNCMEMVPAFTLVALIVLIGVVPSIVGDELHGVIDGLMKGIGGL